MLWNNESYRFDHPASSIHSADRGAHRASPEGENAEIENAPDDTAADSRNRTTIRMPACDPSLCGYGLRTVGADHEPAPSVLGQPRNPGDRDRLGHAWELLPFALAG